MEPRDGWGEVGADGCAGCVDDWTGTSAGCWLMAPFFRAKGSVGASERAVGEGSLPLGSLPWERALAGADTERFIA
ncbi:hypothetical protein GCM10017752_32390 [Streptomyces roseoviridis]